jgi:hypothetical protein
MRHVECFGSYKKNRTIEAYGGLKGFMSTTWIELDGVDRTVAPCVAVRCSDLSEYDWMHCVSPSKHCIRFRSVLTGTSEFPPGASVHAPAGE